MDNFGDYVEFDGPLPQHDEPLGDVPFEDLSRKDTIESKAASEPNSESHPTCRICRSEGSPEEPLFHPCKCSGSIQYVHQECLMEWLSHSHKKHCELCKTPFRFTKLYDANMPAQLPWDVFFRRALVHVGQTISNGFRALIVGLVWLVILPWAIRWAWRWMFWTLDAGWAREMYLYKLQRSTGSITRTLLKDSALGQAGQRILGDQQVGSANGSVFSPVYSAFDGLTSSPNLTSSNQTADAAQWPEADTSIFSSWTYLSELTANPGLNRILLDIFEGQLITCVVIIGFILIFLIREWVVQQQPLVNMDQLNNVQQQLREAADRVQEENERFRRQQELLDQARRRLVELQRETEDAQRQNMDTIGLERPEFIGWERLEEIIDVATERLRNGDRDGFEARAPIVTEQIRAAGYESPPDLDTFTDTVYSKLASFPDAERREWEAVLVSEIRQKNVRLDEVLGQDRGSRIEPTENDDSVARPPMPEREFSSRATQIQRLLEEADGIFGQVHGDPNRADTAAADAGSSAAASSSTESWQHVAEPGGPSLAEKLAELSERISEPHYDAEKEGIPVANAGPDAKKNIKRSGTGNPRPVPEPKPQDEQLAEDDAEGSSKAAGQNSQQSTADDPEQPMASANHNQSNAEVLQPQEESLATRVGSAFREEFGLDEIQDPAARDLAGAGSQNEAGASQTEESRERRPHENRQDGYLTRLADWFWGDINVANAVDSIPAREERVQDQDEQQPRVQEADGNLDQAPQRAERDLPNDEPDPEVAAAAAQAGLEAEAIEDAEDLEGIFELMGLQGPLTALFQTSMFCLVLVSGTVFSAVGLPYAFGKLVLSFIGSPVYFIFKLPLQSASFVADFAIDTSLFVGGWTAMVIGCLSEVTYKCLSALLRLPASSLLEKLTNASMNTATASGARLQSLFVADAAGDAGINEFFLGWSVHSHASLRDLQEEINAVLSFIGHAIFSTAEVISSGSPTAAWDRVMSLLSHTPVLPSRLMAGVGVLQQWTTSLFEVMGTLKTGALTLKVPSTSPTSIEPGLVFWNSSDRVLAVLSGYIALAMVAALYVAADTPITSSPTWQRYEKMVRDTLRQAGGVLKVILIISIEMLVFPLYCGLLLDLAFLPLFGDASVSSRLNFAATRAYTFCFTHWFVGTCYMFHFALFVGICRKILRKGVLWFIRDPDDPTFHPVRDVLERNVTTQLRKIAFSALVYGALVILCLGGVIWTIGKVFKGIFPIQWLQTEPVFEFPFDLLLYNLMTPLCFRLIKPSDTVNSLYAWWLRRCARTLRLSHFLFDDRRKDEEGHHVHKSWTSFFLMRRADTSASSTVPADHKLNPSSESTPEVYFQRDGKYVLTPCNDQYRPPKAGEAFLHTDDEDVYIVDKDGNKNEHFAKMYVPPLFRVRVTLFMVCLWAFSATVGLGATLVPLVFGRTAFGWWFPGVQVNDIYSYTIGAYALGGLLYAAVKSASAARHLRDRIQSIDLRVWCARTAKLTFRFAKCAYVYGSMGTGLPMFFAFALQFYLIVPLHTYMVASAHEQAAQNATISTTNITAQTFNQTDAVTTPAATPRPGPWLAEHNVHLLSDFALGLLYSRIVVSTAFASGRPSRAKEAFRRITAAGYLNPNTRLATRFFIIPALILATLTFAFPPLGAWTVISAAQRLGCGMDSDVQTAIFRYSFPCAGAVVAVLLGGLEVARATERWRSRVRDEVYLVGERLHNFGEKKPPAGTKSVVRRERPVGGRREVDLDF